MSQPKYLHWYNMQLRLSKKSKSKWQLHKVFNCVSFTTFQFKFVNAKKFKLQFMVSKFHFK